MASEIAVGRSQSFSYNWESAIIMKEGGINSLNFFFLFVSLYV